MKINHGEILKTLSTIALALLLVSSILSAHAEWKECLRCDGKGWEYCPRCKGTGRDECYVCYGKGYNSWGDICGTCNGKGWVTCTGGCHGSGIIVCSACGGKGGYWIEEPKPQPTNDDNIFFLRIIGIIAMLSGILALTCYIGFKKKSGKRTKGCD